MLARPFHTATSHLPAAGAKGNLQVVLRLPPAATLTPELLATYDQPLRALATFGAGGGAAGDKFMPASSRITLLEAGTTGRPNELLWSYEAVNVDPGTLFIIENLIHALHLTAPVAALSIHSNLLRPGQAFPSSLPYDYEPYPFETEYAAENPQVHVDVDFVDRQDPAGLEPFRQTWQAWEIVAMCGGFADETYVPGIATMNVESELHIVTPGMSAAYDNVAIADAGFHCLINVLQAFHHRLAKISSVVIE